MKRSASGLLLVVVMVFGILWNGWSLAILVVLIQALGLLEFYRISEAIGYHPLRYGFPVPWPALRPSRRMDSLDTGPCFAPARVLSQPGLSALVCGGSGTHQYGMALLNHAYGPCTAVKLQERLSRRASCAVSYKPGVGQRHHGLCCR
jgi:CDP-diglyceride synthetase